MHPLPKGRQTKGVHKFHLVYATLKTVLTQCLPCSKDQGQDDLSKKGDSPPPCQGDFLLAQQQHTEETYK